MKVDIGLDGCTMVTKFSLVAWLADDRLILSGKMEAKVTLSFFCPGAEDEIYCESCGFCLRRKLEG